MKVLFEESVARNKLEETIRDLEKENEKQRSVIERERESGKAKLAEKVTELQAEIDQLTSDFSPLRRVTYLHQNSDLLTHQTTTITLKQRLIGPHE